MGVWSTLPHWGVTFLYGTDEKWVDPPNGIWAVRFCLLTLFCFDVCFVCFLKDKKMKKCSCKNGSKNHSIHGKCHQCGGQAHSAYNTRPQEPQLPSTVRGKRRAAKKGGG